MDNIAFSTISLNTVFKLSISAIGVLCCDPDVTTGRT